MKELIERLAMEGRTRKEAANYLNMPYVTFCKRVVKYRLQSLFAESGRRTRIKKAIASHKRRARERAGMEET